MKKRSHSEPRKCPLLHSVKKNRIASATYCSGFMSGAYYKTEPRSIRLRFCLHAILYYTFE
jgi:hypothetical protein